MKTLILASRSPRRVEILRRHGIRTFLQEVCPLEEKAESDKGTAWYVTSLATAKASYVAGMHTDGIVIGADTVVCLEKQLLGKPENGEEARKMLHMLSGRSHEVITGVCLWDVTGKRTVQFAKRSTVTFGTLDDARIDWYISTGEPMDKAGSYAIQGYAKEKILSYSGDLENIIGLPGRDVEKALTVLGWKSEGV